MGEEATKTIQTRLHVASGERSWLHDARLASREIFNQTIRLKQQGYNRTEIQKEVDRDDFLRNNKCAVVGKALQTWDSYQSLIVITVGLFRVDRTTECGCTGKSLQ